MEKRYVWLEECALFSTPSPKLQARGACRYAKLACTSCVNLGARSCPVELCTQKRQTLGNVLAHRFPPTPSIGSISKFLRFDLIACNSQTWSGLKACLCCRDIAFPVFGPLSGRDRVTHGTHLPDRLPLILLCSIESSCKSSLSSEKRQDWSKFGDAPFACQKGAKWCQNGQRGTRCALASHFLTQPNFL